MHKYHISLLLFAVLLFLYGCNKERRWTTAITKIDEITYNSADFEIEFDLHKTIGKTYAGYYIGFEPNPDAENAVLGEIDILGSDIAQFDIKKLYANQRYYIQSFIQGEQEVHYSDVISFKTLNTPPLTCALTAGEVYFSGHNITKTVSNLNPTSPTSSPYAFEMISEVGDFTFTFDQRPKSGLYSTRDDVSDLNSDFDKPFLVQIGGLYSYAGSGGYYRAKPNQEIDVQAAADGTIVISFCDLEFIRDGGGMGPIIQLLSGKIVE
jgi:hypothetical protein